MQKKQYGLVTAIAMIGGIVIGSGIFFKADNILAYTGGSAALGVAALVIAAVSIVFGALTLGELAARTDAPGGLIAYAEAFLSERSACVYGWFLSFVYTPAIISVVSWVAGVYLIMLFGLHQTLLMQAALGLSAMAFFFAVNMLSAALGGALQNISTAVKLLPLILIGALGLFSGEAALSAAPAAQTAGGFSWLAAVGPVAFAFDGWIVATAIAPELRDARRTLPRALAAAPLVVLFCYVLYFRGVCALLGPRRIMRLSDGYLAAAARALFGPAGERAVLACVVVSVLGTVNGLVLGIMRMPHALALRGLLPFTSGRAEHTDRAVPPYSAAIGFGVSLLWFVLHYFTQKYGFFPNSDVSEAAVVLSYVFYLPLYARVWRLARAGQIKSRFRGFACPLLAALGALIIFAGGMHSPFVLLSAALCALAPAMAFFWYKRRKK